MVKPIEQYQNLASEMRTADTKRDELFTAMENEDHATRSLTPELAALKWVLPHVNTDPRDSNRAMANILSGLDPHPSYMPVAEGPIPVHRGTYLRQRARHRSAATAMRQNHCTAS